MIGGAVYARHSIVPVLSKTAAFTGSHAGKEGEQMVHGFGIKISVESTEICRHHGRKLSRGVRFVAAIVAGVEH